MAAQPFHRMAPVPPHLTYRPEISTYMDHFRKPQPPIRRRQVMPPQMIMGARQMSARRVDKERTPPSMKKPKVKTTVKDYMDDLLKMGDKAFPPFNARVDVPCKSAQPNRRQRDDLRKIARSGYGISGTEARDIVRADRSVDFYSQHKIPVNNQSAAARVKSAPAPRMSPSKQTTQCTQTHWMTWNSGTPEPPGLQKRLHRPWPTPEPPKIVDAERCSSHCSRSNSAVLRPASGTLLPTKPCSPVPDRIGSEGVNPTLTKDREQAFTPQPEVLPHTDHAPLSFAPNFRQLTNSGSENDVIYIPGQRCKDDSSGVSRNTTPQGYEHPTQFERRLLKETINRLATAPSISSSSENNPGCPKHQSFPLRLYKKERLVRNDGRYGRMNCMFLLTNGAHVSNYNIDPEYVSESVCSKKSANNWRNMKHIEETRDGFRYGTTRPLKHNAKRDGWLYANKTLLC